MLTPTKKRRSALKFRRKRNYFSFLESLEERTLLSFTIAVMPDTQHMTWNTDGEMAVETNWIKSQQSALNIQFAVQMGDIVDHGNNPSDVGDWQQAVNGMDNIAAMNIPFGVVQGNHDHDNWYIRPVPHPITGTTASNQYFGPNSSFFSGKSWYGSMTAASGYYDSGGTDSFQKFTADGQTFLNICLEDEPSNDALAWATDVMNANPGMPVIISTHQLMDQNGSFLGLTYHLGGTSDAAPDTKSPGNAGVAIWNWVAQHDDRIFLVLSAHASSAVDSNGWSQSNAHMTMTGSHGNPVLLQMTDYQENTAGPKSATQFDGGAEWVRLLTIDLSSRTLTERTYSPGWNAYSSDLPTLYGIAKPFDEAVSESDFTIDLTNARQIPGTTLPNISIAASGSPSEIGPTTGTYTLTRTGSTASSLTVNVAMSGTATNGTDYTTIGSTVTFAAGSASKSVTLTPIADGIPESTESAIMTIAAGSGYTIAAPSSATLDIADSGGSSLIAYDGFNYTVGGGANWNGQSGGSGFTTPWSLSDPTDSAIDSGNLSVSGLNETGNSAELSASSSATRTVNTTFGTDDTSLWVGFVVNQSLNGNSGSLNSTVWLGSDASNHIELGSPWNGFYDGQAYINGTRKYWSGTGIAPADGVNAFLVYRIDFGDQTTGTPDKILLWVNPTPGSTPTDASATTTWTLPSGTYFNFTDHNIKLDQSTYWNQTSFDELRLGIQYSDVAPSNGAPIAPSNLSASPSGSNVTLNWHDNSTNETGFHIWRSTDDVNFAIVHTSAINATSYVDAVSAGTYYYKVTAFNGSGDSAASNTASAAVSGSSLIASDDFNYTAGATLNGQGTAGGGWAGSWSNNGVPTVVGTSLTPPVNLVTSGGSFTTNAGGGTSTRNLSSALNSNGTLWTSVLMKPDITTGPGPHNGRLVVGNTVVEYTAEGDGTYHFEIQGNDGSWYGSHWNGGVNPTVANGVTYYLVLEQVFNGGADTVYAWLNPTPGSTAPTTASAFETKSSINAGGTLTNIGLYSSYYSNTGYDEIRVGSSYSAVAPATAVSATVTIAATTANAAEDGASGPVSGVFTVTRSGSTSSALTVNYTVSGTATNGTDYQTIGSSVTIPVGAASATININPLRDDVPESTETATLTLASGTGYTVGSPSAGTVSIADNGLLVYDGFNYTVGDGTNWNGQGGGAGWTNNWTVNDTTNSGITSGSMGYTSGTHALITSGNQAWLHDSNGATRTTSYTLGQDSTSLWIGFEMNQHVTGGTGSMFGGPQLSSDGSNMLQLGSPWNGYYDGQAYVGGTRYYMHGESGANPVAVVDNTPVFLVYRLDFSATGTADSLRLWVNPVPGTLPTDASANFTYTLPAGVNFVFTNNDIKLRDSTYYNQVSYDEFRMGTSYYSVAPDPLVIPGRPSFAISEAADFNPILSSGRKITLARTSALTGVSLGLSVFDEAPSAQAPLAGARRPDASTSPAIDVDLLKNDLLLPGMN